MREKLDELRFRIHDLIYSTNLRVGGISDRTKYLTLSFFVVLWFAVCSLMFTQTYGYKAEDLPDDIYIAPDTPRETINEALELKSSGRTDLAFDLLATHLNHFKKEYDQTQVELLEGNLRLLTDDAEEGNIEDLYLAEDLTEQQPIYHFVGIVVAVDDDPMYGVTYTVSNNGERSQQQLEVTGLVDVSLDSQVEFYGVPKFDSVSSPIKVEAYVLPVE